MQKRRTRGFTLIELLIVIVIIVILASMAYPVYMGVQERARVTQDMNNLRQIGIATQIYLNDNNNVLFTAGGIWMTQLHPKYLSAWSIFQSPFDKRAASEDDSVAPVPISYGLNGNPNTGSSIAGLSMDKVTNPSVFIMFAPAQTSDATTVLFSGGTATEVTVYKGTSNPGGNYSGTKGHGTHTRRSRINALFADLHSESMLWTTFITDSAVATDWNSFRWNPYVPYP